MLSVRHTNQTSKNVANRTFKENTARMVAAQQKNVLLLWHEILNHMPYYGV